MGCPHGLKEIFCSHCKTKAGLAITPTPRAPASTTTTSVHGQGAYTRQKVQAVGYVVLSTRSRNFASIDSTTTYVHIDGHPFLWVLERVLELAPNLRTIRVTPLKERKLHDSHRALCRARGVGIVAGRHLEGARDGRISAFYLTQAKFFHSLQGEQKMLFEELLSLNFVAAEMVARYFCLHGEDRIPQHVIAGEFGYGDDERHVSGRINAVLFYLDPSFKTGTRSQQIATAIKLRVERLRPLVADAEERARAESRLGRSLPKGLPWSRLETFEQVLVAVQDGRMLTLDRKRQRILKERFGLTGDPVRTLRQIGVDMDISHERVRQLEDDALRELGVTEEL